MNDVGGSESGTGLRAGKTSRTSDTNFEYDDNDWDVGIGNLIIDLDANIAAEKNNEISGSTSSGSGSSTTISPNPGSTSTSSSSSQMHIPSSSTTTSSNNSTKGKPSSTTLVNAGGKSSSSSTSDSVPNNPVVSVSMDSASVSDKGLKMKIKRTKPGTKSVDAKHEIVKSDVINASGNPSAITPLVSGKNSNSDVKVLAPTPNSHKDIKDIKSDEKCGPQTSGSDKGKNQKRTPNPVQKKVKPGPGNPVGPSASLPSSIINKKESPDHKHMPNSSGHSGTNIGPSSGKEPFSSSSAFVKATTANATIKPSSQVGVVNLHGGIINTFGTGSAVSVSPNKNDKGHPSIPVSNINLDKSTTSGSFPKKSKPGPTDKNQIMQHEDLSSGTVDNAFRTGINMGLDIQNQNLVPNKGSKNSINNSQDACVGTSVGTITEPDCLGPCEPGSAVTLEGIVWHETESGVLVVNVTWRGKTYVGTLLDCTKNDWASPRFCDSPTSDLEMRTPKNRGKRGRAQTATPVSEPGTTDTKLRNGQKGRRGSSSNAFVAPVSPLKPEQWPKRKTRGSENETQEEQNIKTSKRLKLTKESGGRNSNSPALEGSGPYSPQLIECPEPNCSKKYKHINGLRYHQSHAHSNNFAPEDSDSNMSTASTTNANTPAETGGAASDDIAGDSTVDMDITESVQSETNSAPSTPVKKAKDIVKPVDGVDIDIKPTTTTTKASEIDSLQSGNKLLPSKTKLSKEKDESEKDVEVKEAAATTTSSVSRTHILNVPTLMSMANRSPLQTHSVSSQRGTQEASDASTNVAKIGVPVTPTNSATNVPKSNSGVPWQPHANSSSTSQSQSSHVISSLNIPVPLTVPMSSLSSKESDKSNKDLKPTSNSGAESPTKKQKHKKRSKERPDRDRDRENIGKPLEPGNKDPFKGNLTLPRSGIIPKGKEERRSSSEFKDLIRRDSEGGSGTVENPQSPAYSDISDANDSAPESEMNPNENTTKTVPVSEIKKEGTGTPGMPTFFSPFFSPHSLENPYSTSPGNSGQAKPERGSIPGSSAEDLISEKPKSKPQHPEDRRSPNVDYRSKYLPPQQSFYPYPFSNYHFEQQPYGLMPENTFPPGRGMIEEKERETEESRRFSKGKPGPDTERGETGSGNNLNIFNIKQEPVERSVHKEHRVHGHGVMEEKSSGHAADSKSDFGNDFPEMKRHGQSTASHFTSSLGKHSKDFRREDRHSNKDNDAKDQLKRSSSDHPPRHKSSDSSSSIEKDVKNEGAKPTMETTGPPPPPTAGAYAYLPPGYLQGGPFGLPFDPNHHLYRQVMVPNPYPGSPYMHPGSMSRFPGPPGATPLPEDLSRPSGGSSKALDVLQHHAAQYYASHKIHELQERALKSPSPQVNSSSSGGGISGPTPPSTTPASPQPRGGSISGSTSDRKPTDLSKDPKNLSASQTASGAGSESSRSPPIHHVHTHMHSHTHIGYPIIPTVPPQYSPHYGVLTTPPATPATVIPPFTSQKPT